MLRFFEDTIAAQPVIETAIQRFGFAPEHNYWWYQYYQHYYHPPQKNIFVAGDMGALFTAFDEVDKTYFVVFDPMAAVEQRVPLLIEYISWIFSNTDTDKIWFQLDRSSRRELLKAMPAAYRSCPIYYTLTWPIYQLEKFDPALTGGHYKTLRKEMHRFYRDHAVTVADAKTFPDTTSLHAVVDGWKKSRTNRDRGMTGVYHQMIDGKFMGTDEARVFIVNGKPVGFNAGWMMPNRDRFYGAVGIHDYSIDNLGAMLYLEDLVWLKQRGYREVDMGGSEKSNLAFKNKFCPNDYYQADIFSVVKRTAPVENTRPRAKLVIQ
jgi:hypothetical protein